jgi:peptidoglycan/LPS O-acetylase OafA/YrhL
MRSNKAQPATTRVASGRIDSLDSIRGLAALAVLLSHFCGIFILSNAARAFLALPVLNSCVDGKAAVVMFFVLSGFVLARPYLLPSPQGRFAPIDLISFYLKRLTRIYLPFLFVLILSAIARTWFFHHYTTTPPQDEWFASFWCCLVTAHDFLKQCGFLMHDYPRQLINQDWSLGVELKASILLPFYVLIARKSFLLLAASGSALAIFLSTGHFHLSFVMGVLLAYFTPVILPRMQAAAPKVRATFLFIGLLAYETRLWVKVLSEKWHVPGLSEKLIWIITALGCVCILLVALSSKRLDTTLNHRALTFLGRISYSVYLLHFLILLTVVPAFAYWLNTLGIHRGEAIIPVSLVFTLLLVIGTSSLSYEWIERPCMKLGRRLNSLKQPPGHIPQAPVPQFEHTQHK